MTNITIKEDKSYLSDIDLLSIKKGIAELGIYSIRIGATLTEEQKEENLRMSNNLSREEWSERCEKHKQEIEVKIEKIIDTINHNFVIFQYENKEIDYSKDDWDLFFWCNCGDMSYVRLNPNKKRTNQKQIEDINNVLEILKTLEYEGISATIQYTIKYNEKEVSEIVRNIYNKLKNSFIEYKGKVGKIKEIDNKKGIYGFFKKGTRKNYYQMSNEWFLKEAFNE